jgi:hypothetical protein
VKWRNSAISFPACSPFRTKHDFLLARGTEVVHQRENKWRLTMYSLSILFFFSVFALSLGVLARIVSTDGQRMWDALLGKPLLRNQHGPLGQPRRSVRQGEWASNVVVLTPAMPKHSPVADLPLAA